MVKNCSKKHLKRSLVAASILFGLLFMIFKLKRINLLFELIFLALCIIFALALFIILICELLEYLKMKEFLMIKEKIIKNENTKDIIYLGYLIVKRSLKQISVTAKDYESIPDVILDFCRYIKKKDGYYREELFHMSNMVLIDLGDKFIKYYENPNNFDKINDIHAARCLMAMLKYYFKTEKSNIQFVYKDGSPEIKIKNHSAFRAECIDRMIYFIFGVFNEMKEHKVKESHLQDVACEIFGFSRIYYDDKMERLKKFGSEYFKLGKFMDIPYIEDYFY